MDWMEHALCTQVDPELFFPTSGAIDSTRNAKRVCRNCPVRNECLSWAVENPALHGVLGGTTERERSKIRRLQRETAAR